MKKQFIMFFAAAMAAVAALAEPNVTDVVAKQRYPWNGLVDITCKVSGIDGTAYGHEFVVAAVLPDSGNARKGSHFWVVKNGTDSVDREANTNGNYRLLWDAQADLGQVIYTNMVVRVTVVKFRRKVQLWEGGPYWATTNIGAEKPENYGYYFLWGVHIGFKRENDIWVTSDGSYSNFSFTESNTLTYHKSIATLQSEGYITADEVLVPAHDAAQAHWGGSWRMPTKQELEDLNSKCDWTLTTTNGVQGWVVRGKGTFASGSIFLPCAGVGIQTSLHNAGSDGCYWSSIPGSNDERDADITSWYLYFNSSDHSTAHHMRCRGQSVRPVAMTAALAATAEFAGDSAPFLLDTVKTSTSPIVDSVSVLWDASWIGGDANATVVIADNGTEVKCMSGAGEFTHKFSTPGQHVLTYTTYLDGVALAETYSVTVYSQWKYEVVEGGGAVVTETTQRQGAVAIPSKVDGYPVRDSYPVRGIGPNVFKNYTGLTSMMIPSSVTSIGNYAFYGCSGLMSVTIPDSVTSIGERAFYGCSGLTSVTIPNSVTNIGEYAFSGCSGLMSVTIPDSVTSIGERAFYGCSGLTSMTIPNSVTNIGEYAFSGCSGLMSVTIPASVTSIGDSAFSGCSGLMSVSIPSCVTSLRDTFPATYQSITNVTVLDGTTSIGDILFDRCIGLTDVTLPGDVRHVGLHAFKDCHNLTSVTVCEGMVTPQNNAMNTDTDIFVAGLQQVKFDTRFDTVSTLTDGTHFDYVSGVIAAYARVTESPWEFSDPLTGNTFAWNASSTTYAYFGQMYMEAGRTYVFGAHFDDDVYVKVDGQVLINVTQSSSYNIYKGSYNCNASGWYEVEFRLGDGDGCKGSWGNKWGEDFGLGYRDDGETSDAQSGWKPLLDPGDGSLFRARRRVVKSLVPGLKQVKFNTRFDTSSTSDYGEYFDNVSGVIAAYTKVTASPWEFSDPLTGNTFAWNASSTTYAYFGYMYMEAGRTYVFGAHFDDDAYVKVDGQVLIKTMSSSYNYIHKGSYNCNASGWYEVEFRLGDNSGNKGSWGNKWGEDFGLGYRDDGETSDAQSDWKPLLDPGDGSLLRTELPSRSMADIFPASYKKIKHVLFAGNIKLLPDNFFDGCEALEELSISESIVDFGDNDMRWMIDRNAPNGLFIKDGWVFGWVGPEPSTSVIPEGVRGIAPYALCGLYNLESVQLPSTLKYIGAKAFAEDSYLDNVVIPDGVETIGAGAFEDCSYMQALTIGAGVKKVGRRAFAGCTQLASAEFADGLCEVGAEAFSNCWRMASVALPLSTTNVGQMAFADCTLLTGVTTPTGHGKMSEWFAGVYPNIQSVTVPEGETTIVPGMFEGCTSLASLSLPDSITSIGAAAFKDCTSLTEMAIPGNVSRLGAGAFEGCSQIATLTLPNGLTELPANVFAGCDALDSFVVPASVTNLGCCFCPSGVTAIYYLGNAPAYAEDAYGNANESLTSYVVRGTKGWDGRPTSRDIPQSWIGHAITTWEATRFDVTFDANGGKFMPEDANTYACEEVTDTGYSLPPNAPVRPGYRFMGYWTEKNAGSRVTSATRVTLTKAHTLYAHWQEGARVTVRFNACGGTVQPGEGTYTAEAPYGELPVPTRAHHVFAGWWTQAEGGTQVTVASETPKANHELFAHWTPAPCIVRFHANDGTSGTRDQEFTYGESVTLAANTFARDGYAFAGWAITTDGDAVYADGKTLTDFASMQGDVVHLYATWVSTRYAVRFDSNGGVGRMDSQTLVRDVETNLVACVFTRTGYDFGGWGVSPAGPAVYEDGASVTNVYELTGSAVALYAVWVPIEYSIHYDPNGGTGEMVAQPMVYDVAAPLASSQFAMQGSLFRGWATAAGGSVAYREGASVMNLSAVADDVVTLYAVWQEKPAEVLACEEAFGGMGAVSLDEDDHVVVTLTNDVSGTVEIPDNVGNVTIDLNGHDMVGDGGGLGETALPGGPAIRIVSGEGEGDVTRLEIVDTSDGENGQVAGGGDAAGIEIAEDAAPSVRLDVNDEIVVLNGDGTEQDLRELSPVDVTLKAGEYFYATLAELGYDVPTNGTPYSVVAKGLPAGLKLKYNAAKTMKVKKGKKVTTVVVKPAKCEWWIEGVPTAALDFFTNPPYLVITVGGNPVPEPLPIEVLPQEVTVLDDLALGQTLDEQFYLPNVTNGWAVSGLPTGLKYSAKLLTTKKKVGKKTVVTTNALPYSVYGKTTKAGLFTITAKKKVNGFYTTMKYRVLVRPKAVDEALFGDLTNITTMAYVPVAWDLVNGGEWDGGRGATALPAVSAVGGKVAKVAGLPTGLALKEQVIKGTPTKPGTYVVTFTKNVKEKVKGKTKTVAKTAQILWTVVANDAELSLEFNKAGGVIESGSVGLRYGDLLAFSATSNAVVKASGLPKGITLVDLGGGKWGFRGFTAAAGTYLVTVTATLKEKGKTVTQRLALRVDALPAWAKGTFNGFVAGADGATNGLATVTVSAAGTISGKFQELGTNWTLSAACYTARNATGETPVVPGVDAFICTNVVAKYAYKVTEKVKGKKKTVTKYVTRKFALQVATSATLTGSAVTSQDGVATMEEVGVADVSSATTLTMWQNLWGRADYKALGKRLFYASKTVPYRTFAIDVYTNDAGQVSFIKKGVDDIDKTGLTYFAALSLKVTPAGAVTATLSYDTGKTKKDPKTKKNVKVIYKATCATVVLPTTAADADPFAGGAWVYFAPSAGNGFGGLAGWVLVP